MNRRGRTDEKSWRTNRHKLFNFISTSIQPRRWPHIKRSAEMKTSKLLAHGSLLAVAMFLYAGFALGAFQSYFFVASFVWIPILIILGFAIRRRFWPTSISALAVVGFGLLSFLMILFFIGVLAGTDGSVIDTLWDTGAMVSSIYLVWFWLPFSFGVALGGLQRTQKQNRVPGSR